MQTIGDLLTRDLREPIEEVVKLSQQDEQTVYGEITEYVATERIKSQYLEVLRAMADAPSDPTEGVGVWISGFFGSGKSSFAKNLGYILANRQVLGRPAAELFIQQLEKGDPHDPAVKRIADLVRFIDKRFETQVLMFDVQVDRAVRRATEPIAEIMYTVLLRELDYAEDYDVADLEIELEAEGRLADFVRACGRLFADPAGRAEAEMSVPVTLQSVTPEAYSTWQRVRKGAQRIQRASAILHEIDAQTYPSQDSWATSLRNTKDDMSIRTLVNRTFELAARRRPGHGVVFIIDEVGAYVARSADKIEDLRAVVEQFGQESKNRMLAHKAVAPVWVLVTSQEKLDEVVAAIDDKRVELAKLQDRFKIRIDMAPADIREVATRRVLTKKPEAVNLLRQRFESSSAMLKSHTRLERTNRRHNVEREDFVQFYPYLPHFIDLSIDIVSGIRLQPGAPKHIGGSNRTIIKQTYEMLVSQRTRLADKPIGTLVTLDRIYDLIEGNLSSEKQKDITDIAQTWPDDPWPAYTAKAMALLEYVRDLPRTEANLAALLYRQMGDDSPLARVTQAVAKLREAQFIRQTESGWKLQTAQEKSWTARRNAFNPHTRERNDLLEDRFRVIFTDPNLIRYRYHNLRNFRVGVTWNNRGITGGDAQVPLALRVAEGPDVYQATRAQAREDSRTQENELIWVMSLHSEIDALVAELYRSRRIVAEYDQLRAQNKISNEEASRLEEEKTEALRLQERLKERLLTALANGCGYFRGVAKDGAALGKTIGEILKAFFDYAMPDLYPKLEMGARPLKGNEAEEILKAANLNGLPKLFYGPPDGLDLVMREGSKFVVNPNAPILKEVVLYLAQENSYGNKVTGRTLEAHFGGLGYGWESEMLWLALATLLRGGAIEVTYQGKRYRNHLDPQVRTPFSGTNAFRSASFAPREAPGLATLVAAARRYEELTGEEVDVDETAIAQAFQRLARAELENLLPVEATVRAHHIPVTPLLGEYHSTLETVLNSASDDSVKTLAGEGASFKEQRDQIMALRRALDEKGLAYLRRVRIAADQLWPLLRGEVVDRKLADRAELLQQRVQAGDYFPATAELQEALHSVENAYREIYRARHKERQTTFRQAVEDVKGQAIWLQVPAEMQESMLRPLTGKDHELAMSLDSPVCDICQASLPQMASDLAAMGNLRSDVLLRAQQLTAAPEDKIERVRMADIAGIGQTLSNKEEVDQLMHRLRDHLLKLVDSGVKIVLE